MVAGLTVDVCQSGCGGIWFDQGELSKLDAQLQALGQVFGCITTNPVLNVDLTERRRCPRCPDSVLMRHFFSATRAVTIDECPTCAGIWLDSGELEQIQSEHSSAETRRHGARQLFEEGAIDARMALIRQQIDDAQPYDTLRSRILSSLLVAFYVVTVSKSDGIGALSVLADAFSLIPPFKLSKVGPSRILGVCILPLVCVWFPDALGELMGGHVNKASPRSFVWFLGWFVLLLPLIVATILLLEGVRGSLFTE